MERCWLCGHPYPPHSLIATTTEPTEGGIILCPVPGCDCLSTWGPVQKIPADAEVAALREELQRPR